MLIAIIIFLSAFSYLAWRRLDWALLVVIAGLPTYLIRFKIFGLPLTLLEAMILLAGAIWLVHNFWPANKIFLLDIWEKLKSGRWPKERLKRPAGRQPYPYAWEIIILLIISLLAAGLSAFSPGALGIWKAYFFEPILLFILLLNVFKNKKDIPKIFGALAIAAGLISLFALWQKFSGQFIANPFWQEADTRRVVSVFGYPNAVGLYLAPLIMIFSGWLVTVWKKSRALSLALIMTIILSVLAIYYARSDGALAALVGAGLIFGLAATRRTRVISIIILIAALGSFYFYSPFNNFSNKENSRGQKRANYLLEKITLNDLSGEIRKQQWQESWEMLKGGRLLSGAGLNNYQSTVAPYHQEGIFFNFDKRPNFDAVVWASSTLREMYWQPVEIYLYPHNIFLNFWSELGLVGLLLFIWLIAKFLFINGRLARIMALKGQPEKYWLLGLLGAMLTVIIHGLVDVPYFKNDLAAMFWIILALGAILEMNHRLGPPATNGSQEKEETTALETKY